MEEGHTSYLTPEEARKGSAEATSARFNWAHKKVKVRPFPDYRVEQISRKLDFPCEQGSRGGLEGLGQRFNAMR
jgi:hypothetical protein